LVVRHLVSRDREKEESVGELADVTGVRVLVTGGTGGMSRH
jgi:hypothetical protein